MATADLALCAGGTDCVELHGHRPMIYMSHVRFKVSAGYWWNLKYHEVHIERLLCLVDIDFVKSRSHKTSVR